MTTSRRAAKPAARPTALRPSADLGPAKVADRLAFAIVKDLAVRKVTPGTVLPGEAAMTEGYGVARATLREALRILEANGIIAMKSGPGGGPVVRAVDSTNFGRTAALFFHLSHTTFGEIVQARLLLEPVMAAQLARHPTKATERELKAILRRTREAELEDVDAYLPVVTSFHHIVCAHSGNSVLNLYAGALGSLFENRVRDSVFPVDDRQRACQAHEEIAAAIIGRDPDLAEKLMREHMEDFAKTWTRRHPGLLNEEVSWR